MTAHPLRPVAVVGPTAAGKSDLALDLAQRLGGEIVNIDAMQRYRGMDIGTAKLPLTERRGIVHHQLDVLDVTDVASVAKFQECARADVEGLLAAGKTPVIVGGSMMYYQALLDEWDFPATDPRVRATVEARLSEVGPLALHGELGALDPAAAAKILPSDGRRIVRAIEVVTITGQPFAASAPTIGPARWDTAIVAVDRDTDELDRRIEARTGAMFDAGFVDEVRALEAHGLRSGVTASRAIGYAQVLAAIDGKCDIEAARADTTQGTRRYVRRQRSWFRRDPRVVWLDGARADLLDAALAAISGPPRTS